MKFLGSSNGKSRFKKITITIFIGWFLLMFFAFIVQSFSISSTRDYEVEQASMHYKQIFERYNSQTRLISSYFTDDTINVEQEDFVLFVESLFLILRDASSIIHFKYSVLGLEAIIQLSGLPYPFPVLEQTFLEYPQPNPT